jgi:catechol 2,3-dioxygenase-like lactoylglutathione lyase family enzyme
MKPRLAAITIGVDDLDRSLAFYRDGLGLPTQGIVGTEFEHGATIVREARDTFWEATPGISRIQTGTSGKSSGTRSFPSLNSPGARPSGAV